MIENTPKVTDLAKCMGDYSLITLDVEKLDAVIKVLREVAGGESDSTKTKKSRFLTFVN
mgnify:CR=1 FL=1